MLNILTVKLARSDFAKLSRQCADVANEANDFDSIVFDDSTGFSVELAIVEDDSPEYLEEAKYLKEHQEFNEKAKELAISPKALQVINLIAAVKDTTPLEVLKDYMQRFNEELGKEDAE
jgi:hypothetical protein